jgi:hypothetical protein
MTAGREGCTNTQDTPISERWCRGGKKREATMSYGLRQSRVKRLHGLQDRSRRQLWRERSDGSGQCRRHDSRWRWLHGRERVIAVAGQRRAGRRQVRWEGRQRVRKVAGLALATARRGEEVGADARAGCSAARRRRRWRGRWWWQRRSVSVACVARIRVRIAQFPHVPCVVRPSIEHRIARALTQHATEEQEQTNKKTTKQTNQSSFDHEKAEPQNVLNEGAAIAFVAAARSVEELTRPIFTASTSTAACDCACAGRHRLSGMQEITHLTCGTTHTLRYKPKR